MPKISIISLFLALTILFFSCKKDKVITDPSAKLRFEQDSVLFDTIFTTIGSTTRYFKVYNDNNLRIKISNIHLGKGNASPFRFNADGIAGKSVDDVEIDAHDSMYVFVEVTVDPTNQNNPLIIRDSLVFETNGKLQDVDLEAWGQDAYFHLPDHKIIFTSGGFIQYEVEPCTTTWHADKPHVVYGYAVVDSACKLDIDPGTNIYFHQSAGIWVYRYGTISVNGTLSQPVTFQGDRLEADYKDLPGQWDRIWINEGSTQNYINYAIIKNGFIGVQHDLLGNDVSTPRKLVMNNTIIKNMNGWGIFSVHGNIEGYNNLVCNCGKNIATFLLGGSYKFYQSTFANYYTAAERTDPVLFLNNYSDTQIFDDTIYFGNCIFEGANAEEIALDSSSGGGSHFNFIFENSMLKTGINMSNPNRFISCQQNKIAYFKDVAHYDFTLNSNSEAINKGKISIGALYPIDLKGTTRDSQPDCGAYEFQ